MDTTTTPIRVIISGGGFGGVKTALELGRDRRFQVTLISSDDHFAYFPQLYHAATGGAHQEASIPLQDIFARHPRVQLVRDTVANLNVGKRVITGTSGTDYSYDELVLALGSVTNFFGIKGLQEYSYGIKSITEADRFKHHLHDELTHDHDPELNYVVIGGGATGVELSGALGRYLRHLLRHHLHNRASFNLDLVEGSPRLLPRSAEQVSAKVQRRLEKLGVKVITGQAVGGETPEGLQVGGQTIQSQTVVWTAGVANNPFFAANAGSFQLAKNGRVQVNQFMQANDHVYVIGDNAAMPHGGLAESAINDAKYVARALKLAAKGRLPKPYRQPLPVSVIPVGDNWAAVEWGRLRLYGYAGWILRRLGDLVGYLDVLSPFLALQVWLSDGRRQDDCPICDPKGGRQVGDSSPTL